MLSPHCAGAEKMVVSVQAKHPQGTPQPMPALVRQNAGGSLLGVFKGFPLGWEERA